MKVAAIQMVSGTSVESNLETAERLVRQAVKDGAQFILLPEYWPLMGQQDTDKLHIAEPAGTGRLQHWMQQLAAELGIWLVGGTIPLVSPESGKVLNTSLVYRPDGSPAARYDKLHLFGFSKGEESYQESRTITAGEQIVSFEAPFGRVGMAICYDLRFPELFRQMGDCHLLLVPAAFTYTTGQAHWEILLRARAIENQCYVLACGQGGKHQNGRRTWGHSMLIDPWGEIVAQLAEGEGVVAGDIDGKLIDEVRSNLPALQHRRFR